MTDREKALAYFRNREAQIPMPGARAMYQEAIKALEQPEVIQCKDCKYWREHKYAKETKRYIPFCGFNAIDTKADDYCSRAERRTNGSD